MLYGDMIKYTVTMNVTQINTITTSEQNVTVTGVGSSDVPVGANMPSTMNAGIGIAGARVGAANVVTVRFINTTAANVTPGNTSMDFYVVTANSGGSAL